MPSRGFIQSTQSFQQRRNLLKFLYVFRHSSQKIHRITPHMIIADHVIIQPIRYRLKKTCKGANKKSSGTWWVRQKNWKRAVRRYQKTLNSHMSVCDLWKNCYEISPNFWHDKCLHNLFHHFLNVRRQTSVDSDEQAASLASFHLALHLCML